MPVHNDIRFVTNTIPNLARGKSLSARGKSLSGGDRGGRRLCRIGGTAVNEEDCLSLDGNSAAVIAVHLNDLSSFRGWLTDPPLCTVELLL